MQWKHCRHREWECLSKSEWMLYIGHGLRGMKVLPTSTVVKGSNKKSKEYALIKDEPSLKVCFLVHVSVHQNPSKINCQSSSISKFWLLNLALFHMEMRMTIFTFLSKIFVWNLSIWSSLLNIKSNIQKYFCRQFEWNGKSEEK